MVGIDSRVSGRYVYFEMIENILQEYKEWLFCEGVSTEKRKIPVYKIGSGDFKILMWSQMHGNESTTTKSILDLFNFFKENQPDFLSKCQIFVVPMLNPDGAFKFTRVNSLGFDLNRDAQTRNQKETQFLFDLIEKIKPDFALNLHGQRTIFSAGNINKPATISFLAPSEDQERTITETRKKSMQVIAYLNEKLQQKIPNQIGRYDDSFNINCTGDTLTTLKIPTILFEDGHFYNDYHREKTRIYITYALFLTIEYLSNNTIDGSKFEKYFEIPENQKLFFDVLIKNNINKQENIGILFEEILVGNKINFVPKVTEIGELKGYFGHKEYLLSDFYYNDFYSLEEIQKEALNFINNNIKNIIN